MGAKLDGSSKDLDYGDLMELAMADENPETDESNSDGLDEGGEEGEEGGGEGQEGAEEGDQGQPEGDATHEATPAPQKEGWVPLREHVKLRQKLAQAKHQLAQAQSKQPGFTDEEIADLEERFVESPGQVLAEITQTATQRATEEAQANVRNIVAQQSYAAVIEEFGPEAIQSQLGWLDQHLRANPADRAEYLALIQASEHPYRDALAYADMLREEQEPQLSYEEKVEQEVQRRLKAMKVEDTKEQIAKSRIIRRDGDRLPETGTGRGTPQPRITELPRDKRLQKSMDELMAEALAD